jgi:hypothetical protein
METLLNANSSTLVQFRAVHNRENLVLVHAQRTGKGAQNGDLFMSLIHTCELSAANVFGSLTDLQRHAAELGLCA